ncbi:hypothetical protein ACN42_g11783 [Penicillium freii]|uniref:Phosphatidylserine decarboxylase n=1 Tax=Penicillium freii TaxID=48697 RepID=A0A101M7X2_PENFR|nr:hypothetical protein ACN42_g11783 [Penicillium freii]
MPAESTYAGNWQITNGKIKLQIKGVDYYNWPVKDLLQTEADTWNEGHFTHSFLGPSDYHRQHAPVTGEVIEARVIQNQVYLQVAKNTATGKIYADRAIVRAPAEVKRADEVCVFNTSPKVKKVKVVKMAALEPPARSRISMPRMMLATSGVRLGD